MSAAALRCLEDYMDDVIDSFEDFVKTALLILAVVICVIFAMLLYIVRALHSDQCSSRRPSLCRRTSLPCTLSAMGITPCQPKPPVDLSRPVNVISIPPKSGRVQYSTSQDPDYSQEREIRQDTYVDAKCSKVINLLLVWYFLFCLSIMWLFSLSCYYSILESGSELIFIMKFDKLYHTKVLCLLFHC